MSTISKTAKASMKAAQQGPKDEVVISDAERIRLLRIEVASHIYPSSEHVHALLRGYDIALAAATKEIATVVLLEDRLAVFAETLNRLTADNEAKDATIQNLEAAFTQRNEKPVATSQPSQVPPPPEEIDPSLEEPLSEPTMDGFGN
jgi:hypothetical protein